MSDQERLMDSLRKEVRSLLMAVKEGLTAVQLESEYLSMIGKPLPLRTLGYQSTMELVKDMPDVVSICSSKDGSVVLKVIADEATRGIANLVARQRTSSKARNSTRRTNTFSRLSLPRRGRTPPILPAVVKSELKDLLSLSPVLLSDFDKAFTRRFGRPFQYVRYGFFSMVDVLNAASDIVAVEQTRAGSLLTLKRSFSVKQRQEKLSQGEKVTQPKKAEQAKSDSPSAPAVRTPPPGSVSFADSLEIPKQRPEPVEAEVGSCGEKLKQLEKNIKMIIAQKGAGGTVSSELKEKIRVVAAQYPEGLLASKLPGEFEAQFKEKLSVKELGFLNVMDFVGALNDILHVECKEGEQDWLVFDLESKCLADDAAELKVSTWDFRSENSESQDLKKSREFNVVKKMLKPHLDMEELQLAQEIAEPEIPPDAVQDRRLYCLPTLDSSMLVGVFVEYIISPNQFYIRIYSRETSEMLEDMMIEMRRCYSNKNVSDRYVMPEDLVRPGHLCCVRISEDKWWYRVIVHRVLSQQKVEVFFPDFGNMRIVQKSSLRFLKCCYSKLAAQAIPCSLAWVKPIKGHWTTNAILQFWKLCSFKPLVGVVDEYVNGVLHLFLCDTTSDEDIYIHQVLRTEGHAVICRENSPSEAVNLVARGLAVLACAVSRYHLGFMQLNPSVLYLQPSLKQENDGSAGPDVPPQEQESFCEVSWAVKPELKESEQHAQRSQDDQKDPVYFEPERKVQEYAYISQDSQGKDHQNYQESPNIEHRKPKQEMQDGGRLPLEMPYLEPVSVNSDVWDENWLPLQTLNEQIGIGQDPLHLDTVVSSSQTSSHEGGSQSLQSKEQQVWHFAVAEETWDDAWPLLDHMDMTRTAVENSKFPIQEKMGEVLEPIGGLKTPASPGNSSDPVLSKSLEEFYVSLFCSQPSAEQSHLEPNPNKIPPNKVQFLESPPTSASLTSAPVSSDKQNGEVIQEKVKNEDLSGTQVITLNSSNSCTNRGTEKQNSLILAAELQVSKKLYIPRSSPTAALGAAARLATSSGLFHWLSVLRKLET